MATGTTYVSKLPVVAQIQNDILKEMERILIRDSVNTTGSGKKFQDRAMALRCSGKISAKQAEEKMRSTVDLLRSITPKGNIEFEIKPPAVPKRYLLPACTCMRQIQVIRSYCLYRFVLTFVGNHQGNQV